MKFVLLAVTSLNPVNIQFLDPRIVNFDFVKEWTGYIKLIKPSGKYMSQIA
jgi:hypothetical protein